MNEEDIFDSPDRIADPRAAGIAKAALKCLESLNGELSELSSQLDLLADSHDEESSVVGGAGLILRLAANAAQLLCDQRIGDAICEAGHTGWE